MARAVELAKMYQGRLVVIKADGERLDLELAQLDQLTLEPDDEGVLRYKALRARRAVAKGRKLFVEEFQGQPKEVRLEIQFFRRDHEPAGVVDVDPVSVLSAITGDADAAHASSDTINAMSAELVWEEITFQPRGVKTREG